MRSPYGGFSTSVPRLRQALARCSASAVLNVDRSARRRRARRCARRSRSCESDTSPAKIGTALACTRACARARCSSRHALEMIAPRRQALEREARAQARRDAASELRGFDGDRAGAAARVEQRRRLRRGPASRRRQASRRRAFPSAVLRPWRPRVAPAALEQRFARDCRRTTSRGSASRCSTSGRSGAARVDARPLAGGVAQRRRTTASLMRSAAKFRLRSGERCAVVSTRSVCCGVIQRVQSTPRAMS